MLWSCNCPLRDDCGLDVLIFTSQILYKIRQTQVFLSPNLQISTRLREAQLKPRFGDHVHEIQVNWRAIYQKIMPTDGIKPVQDRQMRS